MCVMGKQKQRKTKLKKNQRFRNRQVNKPTIKSETSGNSSTKGNFPTLDRQRVSDQSLLHSCLRTSGCPSPLTSGTDASRRSCDLCKLERRADPLTGCLPGRHSISRKLVNKLAGPAHGNTLILLILFLTGVSGLISPLCLTSTPDWPRQFMTRAAAFPLPLEHIYSCFF